MFDRMQTQYRIERWRPCARCKTEAIITHPEWELYYKTEEAQPPFELWFRQQGYEYPPDEDIECPDCDGRGYINEVVAAEKFIDDHGLMTRADVESMLEALAATFRNALQELNHASR